MINNNISPSEYFNGIKSKVNTIDDKQLKQIYENCLELSKKYLITGQKFGLKKLIFHMECIDKEYEIIKAGINKFIYRDDIEEFIEDVADKTVKLIDLENYIREIPDEVVLSLSKVKDKFDKFYVLYTDYTGKEERRVNKERRDKDPILFGTLQDFNTGTTIDRFYFIGDWEDEYCDLTLDKFVNEMKVKKNKDVLLNISPSIDLQDIKNELELLEVNENIIRKKPKVDVKNKVKNKFNKVRSFLKI